jgi:glycosyltransferase involved in cell wall biosynthesis
LTTSGNFITKSTTRKRRVSLNDMPFRYTNLRGLKLLWNDYLDGKRGIRSADRDRVTIITGYEGTGKSNLLLHAYKIWYEMIGLAKPPIKFLADNKVNFVVALKDAERYYLVAHDEAGKDLYSRKSMSSFSTDMNQAYMVIRGKNLHTILVIPNILDLDSFFRKRRVTGMFFVYSTGRYAYYTKSQIRKLLPHLVRMSSTSAEPNPMKVKMVKPFYLDTFPKYEGALLDEYLARKSDNMDDSIMQLYTKYMQEVDESMPKAPGTKKMSKKDMIIQLLAQGKKGKDIVAITNCTPAYVSTVKKNYPRAIEAVEEMMED